jgi:hypothetical protein
MKRLYSVIASSPREVSLMDPDILIESGVNVFTMMTADVDEVVERLESLGVHVRVVHCISQPETGPEEMQLAGDEDERRLEH